MYCFGVQDLFRLHSIAFCWYCLFKIPFLQVGAKSRNIAFLKDKVPSWVGIPTSVALPFGAFEKVISVDANKVDHL